MIELVNYLNTQSIIKELLNEIIILYLIVNLYFKIFI